MVLIPCIISLDFVLQSLGLSKADYHLELCEDNQVRVTVTRVLL
jgi:hypothetical protein